MPHKKVDEAKKLTDGQRLCSRCGVGWDAYEAGDPKSGWTGKPRHFSTCPDCRAKARVRSRKHYNEHVKKTCSFFNTDDKERCMEKIAWGMPWFCLEHEEMTVRSTLERRQSIGIQYEEQKAKNVAKGMLPGDLTMEGAYIDILSEHEPSHDE